MMTPAVHPEDTKSKVPGKNHPEKRRPTQRHTIKTPQNRIKSRQPVRFSAAC